MFKEVSQKVFKFFFLRSFCEEGVSAGFEVLSRDQRYYCEQGVAGLSSGDDSAEGASSAISRWVPALSGYPTHFQPEVVVGEPDLSSKVHG